MRTRPTTITLLLAIFIAACHGGAERADITVSRPAGTMTFAFYNVENLWDPADAAGPGDDDFTPRGAMKWNEDRLERKLAGIARAVRGIDGLRGPDLLGICEVENRRVLERLVGEFLPEGMYEIAHAESPDERGSMWRCCIVRALHGLHGIAMHRVDLGEGSVPRAISWRRPFEKDGRSFTVLVNHWPSRRGGEAASGPRRRRAAEVAAFIIDSLTALDPSSDIVLMGDLNDEPTNASVTDVLDARAWDGSADFAHRMINTAAPVVASDTIGSYYYRNDWETIDQIMLGRGALDSVGLTLFESAENIFAPEYLRDARADPVVRPPHHSYIRGTLYIGGTSDHFPVFLRVGWAPSRRDSNVASAPSSGRKEEK